MEKLVAISAAKHKPTIHNIARHKVVVGAGLWHQNEGGGKISSGVFGFWGQKWSKPWFWGQKMKKTKKSPKLLEVFAILSGDFILENRFFAFSKGGTQENWKMGSKNGFLIIFLLFFDHFWSILAQNSVLRVQITVIRGFEVKPIEKVVKKLIFGSKSAFFLIKKPRQSL